MAEGYSHSFVEPPSKDLRWQCHICQGILREPVLVTCCGGKFCRTCISKWRSRGKLGCPLCRGEYEIAPEKDLERVLLDKKVLCSRHNQGCRWRGELRKVEEHDKKDCQYVSVNCPYECGKKVSRLNVNHHTEKCPKRPQPCEFAKYGCQQIVQFNEKEAHCASHSQHHLTLVLSEITKSERELQRAREDVASHETKLCQMEEHVREAEKHCKQTEMTLRKMKEELHREQERRKRTERYLKQIKGDLQLARSDAVATQNKLRYFIERDVKRAESAVRIYHSRKKEEECETLWGYFVAVLVVLFCIYFFSRP